MVKKNYVLNVEKWCLSTTWRSTMKVYMRRTRSSSVLNVTWQTVHFEFGLSNTLKIHIIRDHLDDRLTETGETLLEEADEHTNNRQLGTPQQGKKQHSMVVHLNSGNE